MTAEAQPSDAAPAVEAGLIARARQGDALAWSTLMRAHQDHVFRLAYLILRAGPDAEDVAQETFIRAYRYLDRFEDGRPLRPWLTRIAVNLARNRRRAVGRYLAGVERLLARTPRADRLADGLDVHVGRRWEAASLWDAVHGLNRIGREVVYLRYFLGMSEAEMAEALGVAPGTVKSRLHRALGRLRRILETEYPDLVASWQEMNDG